MVAHPLAAVLAAAIVVGACTSGASPEASSASAPPFAPVSASPSAVAVTPATPREEALAAYERYMEATVEALADGRAEDGELSAVASDQALTHARRRLRANRRDDVVVTGTLTPSATVIDVELGGDGSTATVADCVLNDLEQVAADDPGRVVAEATGWRQPVDATVEDRDGQWIVTKVEVPLRDGSGSVPPPPDDPPYLRGPAQGPAPPSCVPDDLARQAIAAYEAFRDAYDTALGLGRSGPADPDLPALAATAVDPQLSAARDFASDLARRNEAFRGKKDSLDPWGVATLASDQKVVVYDCVTVGEKGKADAAASEPAEPDADAGSHRLDGADVVRVNDRWKVSGVSVIERGLAECTSAVR